MARRYIISDRSHEHVVPGDLTTLRINHRSPLFNSFGGEIHLSAEEALDLAEWLGRPLRAVPADRAVLGTPRTKSSKASKLR